MSEVPSPEEQVEDVFLHLFIAERMSVTRADGMVEVWEGPALVRFFPAIPHDEEDPGE